MRNRAATSGGTMERFESRESHDSKKLHCQTLALVSMESREFFLANVKPLGLSMS
jgi:hypothetical protein